MPTHLATKAKAKPTKSQITRSKTTRSVTSTMEMAEREVSDEQVIFVEQPRRRAHKKAMLEHQNGIKQGIARRKPRNVPEWDDLDPDDQSEILWYLMRATHTQGDRRAHRNEARCALVSPKTIHLTQRQARRIAFMYFKNYKEVVKKYGNNGADKILSRTKYNMR